MESAGRRSPRGLLYAQGAPVASVWPCPPKVESLRLFGGRSVRLGNTWVSSGEYISWNRLATYPAVADVFLCGRLWRYTVVCRGV